MRDQAPSAFALTAAKVGLTENSFLKFCLAWSALTKLIAYFNSMGPLPEGKVMAIFCEELPGEPARLKMPYMYTLISPCQVSIPVTSVEELKCQDGSSPL